MNYMDEIITVLLVLTPILAILRISLIFLEMASNSQNSETYIRQIKNVIKIAIFIQCITDLIIVAEYYFM